MTTATRPIASLLPPAAPYWLWLHGVFLGARTARFYGRVGDYQLPALEHGQERMLKGKRARLEQLGAERAHRVPVEGAEVEEAQCVLDRLGELLSELAVEFGDDAQQMAIEIVHADLQVKRWAARPDGSTAKAALVEVHCRNGLCPYRVAKGKAILVGRISERGELRCPSCRRVEVYEVG